MAKGDRVLRDAPRVAVFVVALAILLAATLTIRRSGSAARWGDGGADLSTRIVDVNRADAATLAVLPSIGPALAARIVEERSTRGPFASLAELERVRGIGPRTIERIAPHATAAH